MILRELHAEGFMRFERLELTDLPAGVIGLAGENEAGKTTVGEAIAFALFGRTIRTEGTDPTQAIHWERDECRTRVDVELPGRGVHRIERLVARTGEFEARLTGPDGALLAEGPRAVAEALQGLLGLDFSAFRYSFYVAQHELDLLQRDGRDNARRIVCDMLGITTVERARAALEREQEEGRERASTLERDLTVAQALHTEALPAREEAAQVEDELAAARFRQAEALTAEQRARLDREQAERAVTAERERAAALTRVETSLVAAAERQLLLGALRRLEALAEQAGAHVGRVEEAARQQDAPRAAARQALDQAQAIDRAAQALTALVGARRDQLAREVAPETGPDALPVRLEREAAVAARERRTAGWRLFLGVFALLWAAGAGGLAAATRLPAEQPALTFPPRPLALPGGQALTLTPELATAPLGALGVGLAALGVWSLIVRAGAVRRAQAAEEEQARLQALDAQDRRELEACKAFAPGSLGASLGAMIKALEPVSAENVRQAVAALKQAAGPHLEGTAGPAELLADAQARVTKADGATREADGALADARRVEAGARQALAEVRETIKVAFPEGVPQAAPAAEAAAPADAAALEAEVHRAQALVVRARIELEALEHGRRAAPVGEATKALEGVLAEAFKAHAGDAAAARRRYEEQSGLSELLRARPAAPSVDDLRAVMRRERELLDDLLGDEATLRAALQQAEGAARRARDELVQAQMALDEARGRDERLGRQRRRLEELEAKVRQLREVLAPARRELAVRAEAIALLDGLAQALEARFGPALARYLEQVLPRLTGGRYRRVKVGPDLDVRVFSPDRGDFVRLVELSSGTADQVLLALRLGLARALVAARGLAGGHFLFLDEPLASADATREGAFLSLLRAFDDEFAQIFVTSSRGLAGAGGLEDGPFVRTLELTREARDLSGSTAAGASP